MMQWRLMNLIGEYEKNTGQRLSYRRISRDTGLAESTLSAIANGESKRADFATMDTLLRYFSRELETKLSVNDLLCWQPDTE